MLVVGAEDPKQWDQDDGEQAEADKEAKDERHVLGRRRQELFQGRISIEQRFAVHFDVNYAHVSQDQVKEGGVLEIVERSPGPTRRS